MNLEFKRAADSIPELQTLDDKIEVVIIGYPHCPYTRKALSAKNRHPKWKQSGKVLLIEYEMEAADGFRRKAGYRGKFPIVYVRNLETMQFKHIGGGDDLEEYVNTSLVL